MTPLAAALLLHEAALAGVTEVRLADVPDGVEVVARCHRGDRASTLRRSLRGGEVALPPDPGAVCAISVREVVWGWIPQQGAHGCTRAGCAPSGERTGVIRVTGSDAKPPELWCAGAAVAPEPDGAAWTFRTPLAACRWGRGTTPVPLVWGDVACADGCMEPPAAPWGVVHRWSKHMYVDLADAAARSVAAGLEPTHDEPTAFDPAPRAALRSVPQTIRLWTFAGTADTPAPLHPHDAAVLGATRPRGSPPVLRLWLDGPADVWLAVTALQSDGPAPTGARQLAVRAVPPSCDTLGEEPLQPQPPEPWCTDCRPRCTRLPLPGGSLLATEWPRRDPTAGSCVATSFRDATGSRVGPSWCRDDVAPDPHSAEHLVQGIYSAGTGPSLPEAWLEVDGVRLWVLNRFRSSNLTRCVVPEPRERAPSPWVCTGGAPLGGF